MAKSDKPSNYAVWQRLVKTLLSPEQAAKHYDILESIGKGAFGDVSKVSQKSDGTLRAMKQLKFDGTGKNNDDIRKEIFNILTLHQHDNIVQWTDIFRTLENHLAIVMELCDIDLANFMEVPSNREFAVCLDIAKQISTGIDYLHNHDPPLVHSDIKPQNILLKVDQETKTKTVKIADFGLSSVGDFNVIPDGATANEVSASIQSMRSSNGVHGTLPFMAPEMFAAKEGLGLVDGRFRVHVSVDIFALGLVYAYMFCYHHSDYVSMIRQGLDESLGQDMFDAHNSSDKMPQAVEYADADNPAIKQMKQLINNMTSYDSAKRPTSKAVLKRVTNVQATLNVAKQSKCGYAFNTCCKYARRLWRLIALILILMSAGWYIWKPASTAALWIAIESEFCSCVDSFVYYGAEVNPGDFITSFPALHRASALGHLDCIHELIRNGADVNVTTGAHIATPLHFAVYHKQNDVVKTLLQDYNASTSVALPDGFTALHMAAYVGQAEIIQTVLTYSDCDVNAKDNDGRTALHYASEYGYLASVHVLLRSGADANVRDYERMDTPLHYAVGFNHINCVKALVLEYGASTDIHNAYGSTAWTLAVKRGDVAVIQVMTSVPGFDVNIRDKYANTALHYAVDSGHTSVIHLLMQRGAKVDVKDGSGSTPLQMAILDKKNYIAELLIQLYNASIHIRSNFIGNALDFATFSRNCDVIVLLLRHGAKIDELGLNNKAPLQHFFESGNIQCIRAFMRYMEKNKYRDTLLRTPLHFAAMFGNSEVVSVLIDELKANQNGRDTFGKTALHYATERNKADIFQTLLSYPESDAKAQDIHGQTALHYACEHGNLAAVHVLLRNGADVDAKDNKRGETPLHLAVRFHRTQCAKTLVLDYGASTDIRNVNGYTAWNLAAQRGDVALIQAMASTPGFDVNKRDKNERTALHNAVTFGHTSLVYFLMKRGASVDVKDDFGVTPLQMAIWGNKTYIAEVLIQLYNASIHVRNNHNNSALDFALIASNCAMVDLLMRHGAKLDETGHCGRTPIQRSIEGGNIQCIRALMIHGENIEYRDTIQRTPLHFAAMIGQSEIVEVLLGEFHAQIDARDQCGNTALHYAAEQGHVEVIEILLSSTECDVNVQNDVNETALHIACIYGKYSSIRVLVDHGADMEAKDMYGLTPLLATVRYGIAEYVEHMIQNYNVSLNVKDSASSSALHLAALIGDADSIRVLTSHHDCEINAKNILDGTALHGAAFSGCVSCIFELIQHGANVNARDLFFRTALQIAIYRNQFDAVMVLRENGAQEDYIAQRSLWDVV